MAWGLTETAYKRLPRHEQQEMWQFWQWRHELRRRLEELERMKQGGGVG